MFGTQNDRAMMRTERGKEFPAVFEHDCRLVFERLTNSYYLCVPIECASPTSTTAAVDVLAPETQGRRGDITAVDPGIRTFATCYDPGREEVVEWGCIGGRKDGTSKGTELLGWLARKSDRLLRKAKQAHGRHRKRINAVASRIRKRVKNLTDELHKKLALFLCTNYEVVLLPKYSAKGISRKKDRTAGKRRVIGRRTARKLMQMAPYRFRQFLVHKAAEHGTRVVICDEPWTSKTCGMCGRVNLALGGAKTFVCPSCHATSGRDAQAARNVLLRYISVNQINVDETQSRAHNLRSPGEGEGRPVPALRGNGLSLPEGEASVLIALLPPTCCGSGCDSSCLN